jgi:hypothetical protein
MRIKGFIVESGHEGHKQFEAFILQPNDAKIFVENMGRDRPMGAREGWAYIEEEPSKAEKPLTNLSKKESMSK